MSGRNRSWKLRLLLGAFAVFLLSGESLYGQSSTAFTATLSGSVVDPAGAVVNGAKVTLTSAELGYSRTYTTKESGLYSFTFLPPSVYTLEVEAAGFKHYKQEGITMAAGQTAEQQVSLTVGAVTENVEVTSQAPLINNENANISEDLSSRFAEDLPLNFRSVISLTLVNSSVNNAAEEQVVGGPGLSQTADQDISFLNFGGTFFDTAEYLIDGTWDTRADWGGVIYVPSVDDVQEMKIETNAFTAQYGFSSGNVVNIVTKSGTNQFHGDAWEFYANSSADAKYYFNNAAQPAFHRNQFGGTIGGPIKKNKLYFFAYYEGLRQASPDTTVFTLPTMAERGGDFSALLNTSDILGYDYLARPIYSGELYNSFSSHLVTCGGTDNVGPFATGDAVSNCPAGAVSEFVRNPLTGNISTGLGATNIITGSPLLDTIAGKIAAANYWPTPMTSALANNFTGTAASPEHSNEYSGRIDYNLNDTNRLYGRWSQKYQTKTNTPAFFGASNPAGSGLLAPNNRYSSLLGWSHIFSPTFTMNVNFGVNRHVEQETGQGFGFQTSTLGLPAFINGIAPDFPQIIFQGGGGYAGLGAGGASNNPGNDNYITPQTQWTSSVDFMKANGKHEFAFGFTDIWLRLDGGHYGETTINFTNASTGGPDPSDETAGTGNGFASFLLGVGNGTDQVNYQAFQATDKHFLGWYIQDGWKVTPRLTLNLGLRYEIQTAPTERHNAQQYFSFTAENPIGGIVTANDCGGTTPCSAFYPGEVIYNSPSNPWLYSNIYTNLAPRVSVAFQAANRFVLRSGYGIFFVPEYYGQGPNDGYSQTTPWNTSLNNGISPFSTLSGNSGALCYNGTGNTGSAAGEIPCPDAFPSERVPSGNSAGGLQDVGFGAAVTNPDRKTAYVQQWMAGGQYSFTNNDLLDISYVGNLGTNVIANGEQWDLIPAADLSLGSVALNTQVANPFFGSITTSSCGLNNKTVREEQLLLPFPEFCSAFEGGGGPAVGTSRYNALEITYTHRWHSGLDLNLSYTYSKFTDDVQGNSGWAFPGGGNSNLNSYNLSADESVDVSNVPHRFVATYDYALPVGRGNRFGADWSRPVDAVLGGWQWTGILTAESGLPISIQPASNNVGFGFNQRPNFVSGVSPVPANQNINDWINPAAFSQPTGETFGDVPRFISNLHGPKYFDWDMGIQKYWNFTESKRLQFRFEMFNALNHPDFFQPDTSLGDVILNSSGQNIGNFGRITAAYQQRTVQGAFKFYF
jgi:Carboxypeptidase regulatory-like domain